MPKLTIKSIDNESAFMNDKKEEGYHVGTLLFIVVLTP
jgi:hypothetical protein